MSAAIVEVSGLEKHFGALRVIDDLSFVLNDEALGVVGPNGAGKTTLLSLVAGELRADAGQVRFQGRDVTRFSASRRARSGIARTAQVPRPFEGLTVYENVLVGAIYASGSRGRASEELATDALARAGMLSSANDRASSLRLLDRKRLELARALATRPRVLLLDEIAGGLTDDEMIILIDLIRAIRAEGVAIVWIEHIVHALLAVVDRLIAMDAGRTLVEGDPHEVMASEAVKSVYLGDAEP
jgi:branched-chain amino acid transport system ATP-binding protein